MAALNDKYHVKIDGYGFMLARMPRADRHIYGREEAPSFVNKFSSGNPNYRDATFFPHFVQNNWLNGFDQEKMADGGKFYRSSGVDTTNQEKLILERAMDSIGTLSNQPTCFGVRTAASSGTAYVADSYTTLLLHGEGTDASTTITDSSNSPQIVTPVGHAQIDTAQFKIGAASILLDGTDDYLTIPDGSVWDFGTGDWTIDFWVRFNAITTNQTFFAHGSGGDVFILYWIQATNQIRWYDLQGGTGRGDVSCSFTPIANTWYHIEVARTGATAYIFIDGISQSLTGGASALAAYDHAYVASIGSYNDSVAWSWFLNGWIDEFRISKGIVRHTSNFTPGGSGSVGGTYEVYAADNQGNISLWDGITTWTNIFNVRRLQWFDTVASGDTDYYVGDVGGQERAQSQGFQLTTASRIKAVDIYIKKANGTPSNLQVRIETNNAGVPSGNLADANLTKTIAVADISTSYSWVTVEFQNASATLNASTLFHIVLKTAAAANDQNYSWKADASSPSYTSGARSLSADGGSTWTADAAADFLFRVLAENSQANQMLQVTLSTTTKLWLATGNPTNTNENNARLYTYDGSVWVLAKTFTGTGSASALCLQTYGLTTTKLYVGLAPTAIISSTSDGSTWTTSKDIDEPQNPGYVWDMKVYNGRLYAAGGHPEYVPTSNALGFLWSYDDFQWNFVYDFSFTVIKSLCVFDSLLFLGTAEKRLYVYNTASMDLLVKFPWDVSINSMIVHDDKLAIGLGAMSSLTGEEGVYYFDRNGFHKAFSQSNLGVNCLFASRNRLIIGFTGTTIYRVSITTYQASGTIQLSYSEESLPSMDKLWRSIILHYETLPTGCSILVEYKTDESDNSWTNVGTASTVASLTKEFTFDAAFYSKKISLRITLATSVITSTPALKVIDMRYVLAPDFKYMWKMKLTCPDNIIWLDGTEPISTTTAAITLAQATLPLTDAGGFPTKGRAVVVDAGVEDEFTWTGKSSNTLTGVSGLLAHASSGLVVKITGAMLHKQILTLKQAKTFYTFTDIDGLEYTVLFHQYQADDFVVNQTDGLENNVPITLLEA